MAVRFLREELEKGLRAVQAVDVDSAHGDDNQIMKKSDEFRVSYLVVVVPQDTLLSKQIISIRFIRIPNTFRRNKQKEVVDLLLSDPY